MKPDKLTSGQERSERIREGRQWMGRKKGVIDLQLIWVPGHHNFGPNEKADEEAKKAAQDDSSNRKQLLPFLTKCIPHSITAVCQIFTSQLQKR